LLLPLLKNINLKSLLNKREVLLSFLASSLLTVNWGIYIYAVNSGHILEGSLAYFINPILNVAIGVIFFKEKFPWPMRFAVLFASMGILYKISYIEGLPWISLTLAGTFGLYGVTKKLSKLPVRVSSALEGSFFFIPAILFAVYFNANHIGEVNAVDWMLLIGGGLVTGLPLFLFSFAAQRIPYSIMGILQFLAPSLQFLVGVFMFHEALSSSNLIAFALIWIAVACYLSGSIISLGNSSLFDKH
jgi:chloramphenicol-sensitive protein RarD